MQEYFEILAAQKRAREAVEEGEFADEQARASSAAKAALRDEYLDLLTRPHRKHTGPWKRELAAHKDRPGLLREIGLCDGSQEHCGGCADKRTVRHMRQWRLLVHSSAAQFVEHRVDNKADLKILMQRLSRHRVPAVRITVSTKEFRVFTPLDTTPESLGAWEGESTTTAFIEDLIRNSPKKKYGKPVYFNRLWPKLPTKPESEYHLIGSVPNVGNTQAVFQAYGVDCDAVYTDPTGIHGVTLLAAKVPTEILEDEVQFETVLRSAGYHGVPAGYFERAREYASKQRG